MTYMFHDKDFYDNEVYLCREEIKTIFWNSDDRYFVVNEDGLFYEISEEEFESSGLMKLAIEMGMEVR